MTKARAWVGGVLVVLLGTASGGTPAGANPPPPVPTGADYTVLPGVTIGLCGDYEFGHLTVEGTIRVIEDGCDPADAGRLRIRGARVIVEDDGVIDATGVVSGTFDGDGNTAPTGNGGAGHESSGGRGVLSASAFGEGGSSYFSSGTPGSQGGNGAGGSLGGKGGGVIDIEADDIDVSGAIVARGAAGESRSAGDCSAPTSGAGGGSGGSIELRAFAMHLRTGGLLSAAGGDGGSGPGGGGGGSAGPIQVFAPIGSGSFGPSPGGAGGQGLCDFPGGSSGQPGGGGSLLLSHVPNSRLDLTSEAFWYRGSVPLRVRAAGPADGLGIELCYGPDTSACTSAAVFDYPGVSRIDETIVLNSLPSGVHGLWAMAASPGYPCDIGCFDDFPPDEADVTVGVDNDPPVQPAVSAPAQTASPNVTLNVTNVSDALSGVVRVECSNNGSSWTTCGNPADGPRPWTIGSGEGPHTVFVRTIDLVGNVSPIASTTVVLNGGAPSTTATVTPAAAPSGWYRATPTVTLHATDTGGVDSVTYSVTGANATASTPVEGDTASFSLPADGVSTVTYFATDNAGQAESPQTLTLRIDKTAPNGVVVATDRPPDHGGWFNHAFTATWTGTDSTSGVASCTVTPYNAPDTSSGTLHGTCTDVAGNTAADVPLAFRYDATAPAGVAGAVARPPDANGWSRAPVGVSFTGADATSGIASCTSVTYGGPDSSAVAIPGSCSDNAGNTTAGAPVTLKYDASAPTGVTVAADRPADHDGWFNRPFTATWSGSDGGSGIASCTVIPYSGPDASSGSLFGTCRDNAGNTSPVVSFDYRYDATAPAGVTGTASRPPDANGWYNRPVGIVFSGTDPTSGIASCTSVTYSGPDTAGTTVPGSCTDRAGNTAASSFGPLKYDGTGPTTRINGAPIRISVGPSGMNGTVHDTVPTTATIVVTFRGLLGTTSRVATCTGGCGTTNATWSVSTVGLLGLYTVTARATDAAGNVGPVSNAITAVIV